MDKVNSKRILVGLFVAAFILLIPLSSSLFACNGGGGGGGSGGGSGGGGEGGFHGGGNVTENPVSKSGKKTVDWRNSPDQNIEEAFRTPGFVYGSDEKDSIASTWGKHKTTKPKHWTKKHWKEYLGKRQSILRHQKKEDDKGMNSANRNHTIAKGTGYVAAGAGAFVAAGAAPAVVAVAVVGDGLATAAGSLAEGKSINEAVKDGVKKSAASAILSKVSVGKKGADAVLGFVTGQMYDNSSGSSHTEMRNSMPTPDGHDMMGTPHWK